MSRTENKLGLFALIAMCVGSMIGSGLFDVPQNVAVSASSGALLIGCVITFFGMICLAKVFQNLSMRRPDLDAGVYSYAKEGLGNYLGFSSAWGYWISAWIANAAYLIIFSASLSIFFPIFEDGTNIYSLILNSIVMWSITYLCIRGISLAAIINTIATCAKIIPIIIFLAVLAFFCNKQIFIDDLWKTGGSIGSIADQVKNVMLVMVWLFIGVEGANVFSARAKNRKDVGRATIIGFFLVFAMVASVSVLPYGIFKQEILANIVEKPTIGVIMAHLVGNWGGIFINIGFIIAVISGFLTWTMIAAEVPFIAGKRDLLFPKVFTNENKKKSPVGALVITALCQQAYLVMALVYKAGYVAALLLSTAMILLPYLFSAMYALMLAVSGKTYDVVFPTERKKDLTIGFFAVIYGIWLLYAAGEKLLLTSVLYLVGNIVFILQRKYLNKKVFNKTELALCLLVSLLGIWSVVELFNGGIRI